MHDIKWIRENAALFDERLGQRGLTPLSASLLALDDRRRAAIAKAQAAQERRNAASKEIGAAMKAKDEARATDLKAEVAALKDALPGFEEEERKAVAALEAALAEIPNLPLADVPFGKDENDNQELRVVGDKPRMSFAPKEHFDVGEALGMMDFETAAKLSGARFVVTKGPLARLERALGQFMLDLHTGEHGYTEINPPLLVKDEVMFGTAQLPKFVEDQYAVSAIKKIDMQGYFEQCPELLREILVTYFAGDDVRLRAMLAGIPETVKGRDELIRQFTENEFWLIPTSEVPLTNLVRKLILDEKQLPLRFTALTPCFRAEAGAAGRDTRGMIRLHQFMKVELVSITTPEASLREHERMLNCAEDVLKRLDLAYRVVTLCTGDMGFSAQKTYDIEVWLAGQGRYREISSCSVCGDFQARRMNARYRPDGAKQPRFVHTLNGSGVAVGRTLVAVLENYQNEYGSVSVPSVLQPYMGGIKRIEKAGLNAYSPHQ
jgi:seryl-tRNA synthetase